jgi:hypothetical protein
MEFDAERAGQGQSGGRTRLQSSMKPGVGIDITSARQGSSTTERPYPRRIPSSPSTPNLRSLSLSSASPQEDGDLNLNSPLDTPLARSPDESYHHTTATTTPLSRQRNEARSDLDTPLAGNTNNIGRSRTMIRARGAGPEDRSSRETDEFGTLSLGPGGPRYDDGQTIRRGTSTLRETSRRTSSRGVPLNVDTRDLPVASVPTDRTGDPIPYSAPGNSAYPSSHVSPSTPTGSLFQPQQYSFTPSPTKTRHDQAPGGSDHPHQHHLHQRQATRHHLQNHSADFLPQDVAGKMQRWVQEVVVCNFDIDRGPIVERRMIGRPWGKGERANV